MRRSRPRPRANILAAAEALLTEKGPQALKLADVAKAAGVVHATVLHHFGSIADVQAALAERMIRQLVEQILEAPPPETGPAWRSLAASTPCSTPSRRRAPPGWRPGCSSPTRWTG